MVGVGVRVRVQPLSLLSHFNCSLAADIDDKEDDDVIKEDDDVTWWLQQLALNHDPVYYALPVVLIAGIVCDAVSAWLLTALLLRTPLPTRCQGDVTSDGYLLWLAVTSDLWLVAATARALPDYVTGHMMGSLEWTAGYLSAVNEWLSYTCLWLLILSLLSLQSSAVEQVLDILMDILSWDIAEVVFPCLPRGC